MNFESRLLLLRFDGVQTFGGQAPALALFTDLHTGSTFSVEPGESVASGLAKFIHGWELRERMIQR